MGEAADHLYFVMDYVPGIDAARLLAEQGPLPPARAVGLVAQVLQALDYAHAKRFVHRDVKPANILLTRQAGAECARLADFGLRGSTRPRSSAGSPRRGRGAERRPSWRRSRSPATATRNPPLTSTRRPPPFTTC